jgi:hypothetical protein
MTKLEEVKEKRKAEFNSLRELRGKLSKAGEGTPEAKALKEQIDALQKTSKETKEEYSKEFEAVHGCKPENLRVGFRILPSSLKEMKTSEKAMKTFTGRLARIKNVQVKKLIAFAKANGFTALDEKCLNAFCRRKVSPQEKEARKLSKSLEKDKLKLEMKEKKLASLKGKGSA